MAGRSPRSIPHEFSRAAETLRQWREHHPKRTPIPEAIWNHAARLAARYGVSRTANIPRLGYYSLQQRVRKQAPRAKAFPMKPGDSSAPAAFVELPAPSFTTSPNCVIEFVKPTGEQLRVHLPADRIPDVSTLCRDFWRAP